MENFVKIYLPLIGAFLALFKWLYEYTKNLNWQQNKYLVEQYHRFLEKASTKYVHQILDYNSQIPFIDDIEVNDDIVQCALTTHDLKDNFNDIEYAIRKCFDEYFDDLTELIILGECELIDLNNLKILLGYYFRLLKGSENKKMSYTKAIQRYLKFYGYNYVVDFLEEL